jgi:predicted amidophosphoribosyltransferase
MSLLERQGGDSMAIKACSECGKDISTKADKCPHCGAPQKPSQYGCGTVIIVALVGLLLYVVLTYEDSPPSRSSAPEFSVDTSHATQQARNELLQEMILAGLFQKVEQTDRTARVYVTPKFMELPIDQKESLINAVAAWHYTKTKSAHVRLIHSQTGKTVGSFMPPLGLRME